MTAYTPDTQSYLYTHMYDIPDQRKSNVPCSVPLNQDSISGMILSSPNTTKFAELIKKANMVGYLDDIQANCTMFVPDDSFLKFLPMEYFQQMDIGMARQIIKISTIPRKICGDLLRSSPVYYLQTRLNGYPLYITNISKKCQINKCVQVVHFDIKATNGLIHIVSGILQPTNDTFIH